MRIVIAGSRALPRGQAPRLLINFLAHLEGDEIICLRAPKNGEPGQFERDVEGLCRLLSLAWQYYEPEPTPETPGRASVYVRDMTMVDQADLVLLFFTPDEAVEGYSGTAHLMDKALDADRPVYAYTVAADGKVARIGEYDPDDLFLGRVPVVP